MLHCNTLQCYTVQYTIEMGPGYSVGVTPLVAKTLAAFLHGFSLSLSLSLSSVVISTLDDQRGFDVLDNASLNLVENLEQTCLSCLLYVCYFLLGPVVSPDPFSYTPIGCSSLLTARPTLLSLQVPVNIKCTIYSVLD